MTLVLQDTIEILIVDDQALFRSGLAMILGEDPRVSVVGQACDGSDALAKVAALEPDIVLMDLKMPQMDGIAATIALSESHPDVKVIILSTYEADSYVLQALRAGARGYVLKDSRPDAIISSIVAVQAGERVMAGAVANRVLDLVSGNSSAKKFYDGMTGREVEVLRLLASGMANKQIAYRLKISEKTVRNHISNFYEKLHIYDRSQAVLYAVRKGLVEP